MVRAFLLRLLRGFHGSVRTVQGYGFDLDAPVLRTDANGKAVPYIWGELSDRGK